MSRGAESVLFVEKDPRSLRVLRQNLQLLQSRGEWDGAKQIQVWPGDVFQVLPCLRGEGRKFDLILADPPFPADLWMKILETVDGSQVLAEDGLLVMQVRRDRTLPERVGELTRCRRRIYGETSLEFWRCAR